MSRSHITWAEMNTPDGGRLAGYLLERLDQGEQRFAALAIPKDLPDIHLDEVQDAFDRAYERAKRERPNLCVKLEGPGHPRLQHYPDAQGLVILHEHAWVGGVCVNGCADTRAVA
jgi:hypothetical protein